MTIATVEVDQTVPFDPACLDGLQVGAVQIIGTPQWHEPANEWRALANFHGALVVIALQIRIKGRP